MKSCLRSHKAHFSFRVYSLAARAIPVVILPFMPSHMQTTRPVHCSVLHAESQSLDSSSSRVPYSRRSPRALPRHVTLRINIPRPRLVHSRRHNGDKLRRQRLVELRDRWELHGMLHPATSATVWELAIALHSSLHAAAAAAGSGLATARPDKDLCCAVRRVVVVP